MIGADAITSQGVRSVVAIAAHADDLELGCYGTLAYLRSKGADITTVVMTQTPSIHHTGDVYRENGSDEAREAARLAGFPAPILLDYENNNVPYDSGSIQALNRILDDKRPDLVFTHWPGDNQQDHQHTSSAAVTAARHYSNILFFEPNIGRPPVSNQLFQPRVYFDISDFLDVKIAAIRAHESEYDRLGGDRFFPMWEWRARLRGAEIRATAAEAFEPAKLVANHLVETEMAPGAQDPEARRIPS